MASQLRLPEYRSTHRLRYHPYAGRRNPLYHQVPGADEDDEFELPPIADQEAEGILEPFSQGVNDAPDAAQHVQVADNAIKERLRLASIIDVVGMLCHFLRLLRLSDKDEPEPVDRMTH